MTDIEKKALALLEECGQSGTSLKRTWNPRYEALNRIRDAREGGGSDV